MPPHSRLDDLKLILEKNDDDKSADENKLLLLHSTIDALGVFSEMGVRAGMLKQAAG